MLGNDSGVLAVDKYGEQKIIDDGERSIEICQDYYEKIRNKLFPH